MHSSMCMTLLTVVLSLATATAAGRATVSTLEPVDDGPRRRDFLAFRTQLQEILARRDVPALLAVLHPDIRNSLGGDDGIEGFKRLWKLDQPGSDVWRTLATVLSLGGTFETPDTFVAPYVFSRWPEKIDPFEHVALVGSRVRVRASPSATARVLDTLSYEVLRLAEGGSPHGPWTRVTLPDGRGGFVSTDLVRSPIDYRAYFKRSDGRWQMMMLLAGD